MKILNVLIISLFTVISFTSCSKEEVVIPKANTAIFIDLYGIPFNSINKEETPSLDLIVRSGTEVWLNNPDSLNGYKLLTLDPDSKFIKVIDTYLRSSHNVYLEESSDSLNIFDEAANIFSTQENTIIYIKADVADDSIQNIDRKFKSLLDEINYSSKFDKTLLVLMFNTTIENSNQFKILVNGPKIRKGAEVEGIFDAVDLNAAIFRSMDIKKPDKWPGKIIEYLFLKDYRD